MISPDLQQRIALWRQRSAAGEMTLEEYKEAIAHLREGRIAAVASSTASKVKKAAAVIPAARDMLSDMMGGD